MCKNYSFAPPGLDHFPLRTHGFRRGLYSCAAPRLKIAGVVPLRLYKMSSHAVSKAHFDFPCFTWPKGHSGC